VNASVLEKIPSAVVLKNQVPKVWSASDLYNNLIFNGDANCPIYEQIPRIGAFEVSYKGYVTFHFSLFSLFSQNYSLAVGHSHQKLLKNLEA
jgi:hypothetical protein